MKTRAVILAGGEGTRLGVLTAKRAKPAVPFGGKYRIIDFTLSNCVNSGIFDVLVLTQYRPHSLNDHIGRGQPWDLDRNFTGGVHLLQPYKGRRDTDWYTGTADAVWQNIDSVRRDYPEHILILSGDHIYQMDYEALLDFHREMNAEATLCTLRVPPEDTSRFGIVGVDKHNRIRDFVEKPSKAPSNLASMGVYVFNTKTLIEALTADAQDKSSQHDFGKNIIPCMLAHQQRVFAYPFDSYWIDVGTVEAYWEAHIDLLQSPPPLNLYDRSWVIHTRSEERPPVTIETGAIINNSLIADGAVVCAGAVVEDCVLSPGVCVGPNAVVRQSILLTDCYLEANAVVERSIIDKVAVIGRATRVGMVEKRGITVVGKGSRIPPEFSIGQNVIIGADLVEDDFAECADRVIPDGKKFKN